MQNRRHESLSDNNIYDYYKKCLIFIADIGIETRFEKLFETTFLPGLSIKDGILLIDEDHLQYPGDILHEAGHLAVVPINERVYLNALTIEKREHREAEEMMAIAWSYAACIYLKIDPYFVFHEKGYKNGGNHIADSFNNKQYFGVPMLQWKGMTVDEKNADALGVKSYPYMLNWVLN
ncbi:MAG: hypothetical protein IPN87_02520 [Saprospiraceae bacterium]|nr:hypothetical protein [Candidatus Brachybacter algidus]